MTTGVMLTLPIVQFFNNAGLPAVNGSVSTKVGGVDTATYSDVGLTTPLPNPIPLNSRGEVSTAAGASSQCFLTPNTTYVFTLYDGPSATGNQLWQATYVNGVQVSITQATVGAALYPQTAAETSAGVTPVNLWYPEGTVDRYGTNTTPGTTDMTAAVNAAISVAKQNNSAQCVNFLGTSYLVTSEIIVQGGAGASATSQQLTIQGIPQRSVLVNKAPASNATLHFKNAGYFDVRGLVFSGRATFPNVGLLIDSDATGRSAFFNLEDLLFQTNGGGLHLQSCNTGWIKNLSYWPSGGPSYYGSTIDTNGQPYAILADGTQAVNDIHVYAVNVGAWNTVANSGCAVWIDGSSSSAPFQNIELHSIEAEVSGNRSIWMRNVNIGNIYHGFLENTEVRWDNHCVRFGMMHCDAGSSANSKIIIDGTQAKGGCRQGTFVNVQSGSLQSDSANSENIYLNCNFPTAPGFSESGSNCKWINTETTGSVLKLDQLNTFYYFKSSDTQSTTTTLTDDPDLITGTLPKGTYLVKGVLPVQGITTGTQGFDFAFRVGGGQLGVDDYTTVGKINGAISNPKYINNVATKSNFATISTAANTDYISFEAIIGTNGSGVIAIQWSQDSGSANATQLSAGAWMKVERIA